MDYVNNGFYNNTIFHRVILGFMVQGGGFATDMQQKQTNAPIKNEADNAFLDHGQRDFGYVVFGKIVKGRDIADKISQVPTKDVGPYQNVLSKQVVILSAKVLP